MAQITNGVEAILPRSGATLTYAPGFRVSGGMDVICLPQVLPFPVDVDPASPGAFRLPADPVEQARLAVDQIEARLELAGITWSNVIQVVRFSTDPQLPDHLRARMGGWRPGYAGVRVSDTGVPGAKVLYDVTAVAPRTDGPRPRGSDRPLEEVWTRPEVSPAAMLFAPAIRTGGDVDFVFLTGMTAYPPHVDPWNPGAFRIPEGIGDQLTMITDNVEALLGSVGGNWRNVVMMVKFATEWGGGSPWQSRLRDWHVSSTTVGVHGLDAPAAKASYNIVAALTSA